METDEQVICRLDAWMLTVASGFSALISGAVYLIFAA
ncbi:hypothetical protein SAMN05192580_1803 [Sphingomonas jatrophae]|uniref:Uncharacterized protein n=2 Tax=Sphingomonas jatrophae TaxID=1166337 RepID=A0A1I6KKC2_9SPHN|nr:hypothetical protein SAMN05192580_1803 [Sphingomonas jatrophae]